MSAAGASRAAAASASQSRSYWLKTLHQWHWISSALCLIGMLLFAFTGITLNHAGDIEAKPVVTTLEGTLPAPLRSLLASAPDKSPLPSPVRDWLRSELKIDVPEVEAEWSPEEAYVPLPRPGGDAWVRLDRKSGEVEYELTSRGWISYLNDLHKGRHTGVAWSWFIDVFSIACLIFSITGLFILKMHATNRPTTWPLVGLGLIAPLLLVILFIH